MRSGLREGVGIVLVYGAEKENFGFGRHLWRALRYGFEGSGKERIGRWKNNRANK